LARASDAEEADQEPADEDGEAGHGVRVALQPCNRTRRTPYQPPATSATIVATVARLKREASATTPPASRCAPGRAASRSAARTAEDKDDEQHPQRPAVRPDVRRVVVCCTLMRRCRGRRLLMGAGGGASEPSAVDVNVAVPTPPAPQPPEEVGGAEQDQPPGSRAGHAGPRSARRWRAPSPSRRRAADTARGEHVANAADHGPQQRLAQRPALGATKHDERQVVVGADHGVDHSHDSVPR